MILMVAELALKCVDIFMMNSAFKSRLQKNMLSFINHHAEGVVKNVKIKRRYDEMMEELRKESDESKDKQKK